MLCYAFNLLMALLLKELLTYLLTYLLITYLMTCEMLTKASHYKRPDFKILLTVLTLCW